MFSRESYGTVELLRLAHGKANALDLEFCTALVATLDEFARSDAHALVLTGSGSIFSAGVDLVRLLCDGVPYVRNFLPALDAALARLYFLEKPIVAAVNGHAIAGGAIVALACDYRVMAEGRARFGVPELDVGVPFPMLAMEILRASVPTRHLDEFATLGVLQVSEEARSKGLVQELQPAERTLPRAIEIAQKLAAIPQRSMTLHKRMLRAPVRERFEREGAAWGREVLTAWTSDAVLAAVRTYVERTLRK